MAFSSPVFLFFFLPAVYLLYGCMPDREAENRFLAASSVVFYAFGQLMYVPLLLGSAAGNWLFGLWLRREDCPRRLALGLALTANLTLLGVFKYLDFFLSTLNAVLGAAFPRYWTPLPLPGLVLPIGISFYTFQGLSYVWEVYRDRTTGAARFGTLLLYLAFFPQLIAGPIVLYRDVAAQIDRRTRTPDLTLSGLRRIIAGLGKKVLLADTLAAVPDAVFALDASGLDARLAWMGAVCFTLQLYFDFSGYSDMAIGLGRLFGFRFRENFNFPLIARSIRDFWRRWHISLGVWFRDCVYIPLGGNRRGPGRTARNKWLVFFLTGLWHGANWTFVLWGLWHGLFSVLEERDVIPKRLRASPAGRVYTLLVVTLGFTLFRAESVSAAGTLFAAMFARWLASPERTLTLIGLLDRRTVSALCAAFLLAAGVPQRLSPFRDAADDMPDRTGLDPNAAADMPDRAGCAAGDVVTPSPAVVCGVGFYAAVLITSLLRVASASYSPFLYFQF